MSQKVKVNKSGRKSIAITFIWLIIQGVVYYLSVGGVDSNRGEIYFVLATLLTLFNSLYMIKVLPGLTNERGKFKDDSKPKDKIYLSLFILIPVLVIPFVCGLEYRLKDNYFWGDFVMYIATGLYLLANVINLWAMSVNKYFEGTIRIQTDRDHRVVIVGPYNIVRHPGYTAMIVGVLAVPIILGSIYGLIPAFLTVGVIISRTYYEDSILHKELNGYKEYADNTKYRLFPGIW